MADHQDHQAKYEVSPEQLYRIQQLGDRDQVSPTELAELLSLRVTYEQTTKIICDSREKLRELIRDGEIPVLQKPSGRRPGLIEVSAIRDYMDRLRSQANRDAARRSKAAAARRGRGSAA